MFSIFAYPLALAALATAPALVAVYYFRNRFRKKTVSSLMLWRFQTESKEGGRKVERAQFPWIFFLELLTLLTLAFAAAGPRWKTESTTRPLILILDNSISMQATATDGSSALDQARKVVEKIFDDQSPAPTRMILAGDQPESLGGMIRTKNELNQTLENWTASAPSADLFSAIALATELGQGQANLCVVTDQAPESEIESPGRIRWISIGKPVSNVAIMNASRTPNGEQDRVFLEIANFSSRPAQTRINIRNWATQQEINQIPLELSGTERRRLTFNVPQSTATLEIAIGDDALSVDNRIHLSPPVREKVSVQVITDNDNELAQELLTSALDATGLVSEDSESPELTILAGSREALQEKLNDVSRSWVWIIEFPENPSALAGPFLSDPSSPYLSSLELQGILWAGPASDSDSEVKNPLLWEDENGSPRALLVQPILFAGSIPLMSTGIQNGSQLPWIHTRLDFTQSSIIYSPNWPILVQNVIEERRKAKPGPVNPNIKLGGTLQLRWSQGDGVQTWITPDGKERSTRLTQVDYDSAALLSGLHQFTRSNEEQRILESYQVAVNPLLPDESNLGNQESGDWGSWDETREARVEYASLLWILALTGLVLVILHLFAVQHSKNRL